MEQKFNYPKNESELRETLDRLFEYSLKEYTEGKRPKIKGLLEIISADVTIITAIHKIKANAGSETPGSDSQVMSKDILHMDADQVLKRVKELLYNYRPEPIRRVYIDKPGKLEKRPLGIPAIIDRITQECIRMVIEPILEAQFFDHSYGFRPMRDAHMALGRASDVIHKTGYHWIVEGDISKFFDNVNHSKLVRKLWNMGIRDQRILMIIKSMLKAGILGEMKTNPVGTPQGGILSPLLANAYLHILDEWVIREWERKKTRSTYKRGFSRSKEMILRDIAKGKSSLKPAFLVRYADDWILITQSKANADKWKRRIAKYLETNLKLKLSNEKTLITNVRAKPIQFVGFSLKVVKGKAKKGFVSRIRPNPTRLKNKVTEIYLETKKLRFIPDPRKMVHQINVFNSKVRGLINYYEPATWVHVDLRKYDLVLKRSAFVAIQRNHAVKWTPARETNNLLSVHSDYKTAIPTIHTLNLKIGVTSLKFCRWKPPRLKNPLETPFSKEGRELYRIRTGTKPTIARADELMSIHYSKVISTGRKSGKNGIYNFEYYMNRAYAFNRDKGKCRICREPVDTWDVDIHHIEPILPMNLVNKVMNLATVHSSCHGLIHDNKDYEHLGSKTWTKIQKFREKLKGNYDEEVAIPNMIESRMR